MDRSSEAGCKTPSHIANYRQFIDSIAANTVAFGKPVLLFNGDSHMYRSDNPLVAGSSCVIETGAPDTSTKACPDDAYANQAPNGRAWDVPNFRRMRTLHFGLRVADPQRSVAFYAALGYELVGSVPGTSLGDLARSSCRAIRSSRAIVVAVGWSISLGRRRV